MKLTVIETYRGMDICDGWHAPAGNFLVRYIDHMGHPRHPDACPHFKTIEQAREFIDILQDKKAEHAAKNAS